MNNMNNILAKYRELASFLNDVDIEALKVNKSRKELKSFQKELYGIKIRNLDYELMQAIDTMKKEEFPALRGVHHFPDLQKIDFLNDTTKIELDKFLVQFRVGTYLPSLYRFSPVGDELSEKLEKALVDNQIVEKNYLVKCPHCKSGIISKVMNEAQIQDLRQSLEKADGVEDFEELVEMGKLEDYCGECVEQVDLTILKKPEYLVVSSHLKMVKERDVSLDNM